MNRLSNLNNDLEIKRSIDSILGHFKHQLNLFPRNIMTRNYSGQFTVNSKEELFEAYREAEFIDCRINGYSKIGKEKIKYYPPNFIFLDLDLTNFMKYKYPQKMLDKTLRNTLNKISASFSIERSQYTLYSALKKEYGIQQPNLGVSAEVKPTVLWSGNGYHIYLPIWAFGFDDHMLFSKEKYPNLFSEYNGKYEGYSVSELFLLFAEVYLTSGRADTQHRPTYNSCFIRIPNTFNSKCLAKGSSPGDSKVKVIQEWNGYRPPIRLLKKFRRWLVQEEINQRIQNRKIRNAYSIKFGDTRNFEIQWIEKLLQTGIPDGRKETLRLILAPYVIKRKNYEESIVILERWLDKCDRLRPLDRGFNSRQRIKASLKNTKGFLSLYNLELKYPFLHSVITMSINT